MLISKLSVQVLLTIASIGLICAVALSFLGRVHAIGDSFAAFRLDLTVALALVGGISFWFGRRTLPVMSLCVAAASAATIAVHAKTPGAIDADFTLHQHNLRFDNPDLDVFIAHIRETAPDVMTLQEMSGHRSTIYRELGEEFPYRQYCYHDGEHTNGSVAVYVRDLGPKLDAGCNPDTELAWITVKTEQGPVTFVSMHMLWPWPMGQAGQFASVQAKLEQLQQPLIIAGDFNNTPWSSIVSRIAKAGQTSVSDGLAPTFSILGLWPRLRIDHVLVPNGAQASVSRQPKLGSDHNGLRASVRLARD